MLRRGGALARLSEAQLQIVLGIPADNDDGNIYGRG